MKKIFAASLLIAIATVACSSNPPVHKHDLYDTETIITPATCEADGLLQIDTYCSKCEELIDTRTEVIPATGHDLKLIKGQDPICEEGGYEDYYQCNNCDYSTYEYIPPKGHHFTDESYTHLNVIEPTCFFPGSYDVYATCDECNHTFFIRTEFTPAKGHNMEHHEGDDPKCEEFGCLEYDYCTECGYAEIVYLMPTFHHEGKEEIINKKSATCINSGLITINTYCDDCGELMYSFDVDTQPLGHDFIHHEHKDASCEQAGHYQYETCSRCNYSTYKEIAQLEHKLCEPVITDYNFDEDDPYIIYSYPCLYCEEFVSTETIRPSKEVADLSKYYYSVYPGASIDLGLDNNYNYSSLNSAVAGVSMDGKLTTFKEGDTIIYINNISDPDNKTFILVKVSKTTLSFSLSQNSICVEHNLSITNLVLNSNYSQDDLIFASEDLSIAKINDDMTISAVGVGTVKIHAFINNTSIHYVQELEVIENYLTVSQATVSCYLGKTINLKSYVKSTLASDTLTFESQDETIGYTNYGSNIFYGIKLGSVTVDITSLKSGSATIKVSVISRPTVSINSGNYTTYVSVSLSWSSNYYTCTVRAKYEVASTINIRITCGFDSWGSHTSFDFSLTNTNSQTSSMRFVPASGQSASLAYNISISGSVYTA